MSRAERYAASITLAAVLILLLLAVFCPMAHAQTKVNISGNVQSGDGAAAQNAKVKFELAYCNGVPKVNGVAILDTAFTVPVSQGAFSKDIWFNDVITCGTALGVSRWKITPSVNGKDLPSCPYNLTGTNPVNFNLLACATTVPVVPAPSGDTTYLRTDTGNINLLTWTSFDARYVSNTGTTVHSGFNADMVDGMHATDFAHLLNFQAPASPVTGTGSDVTLYTYTLPANTIAAGKGVRITASINHSTGTGSVTYTLAIGGTAIVSGSSTAVGGGLIHSIFMNNPGVTNAQAALNDPVIIGTTVTIGGGTGSLAKDTTTPLAITLTFNAANTEQVTPGGFLVEVIQ